MNVNSQLEDIQNEALYNEVQQNSKQLYKYTNIIDDDILLLLSKSAASININKYMRAIDFVSQINFPIANCFTESFEPNSDIGFNFATTESKINVAVTLNSKLKKDYKASSKWNTIFSNEFFKTKYGTYSTYSSALSGIEFRLSANGLSFKNNVDISKGSIWLNTTITFSVPNDDMLYYRRAPPNYIDIVDNAARQFSCSTEYCKIPCVYSREFFGAYNSVSSFGFINTQPISKSNNWIQLIDNKLVYSSDTGIHYNSVYNEDEEMIGDLRYGTDGIFIRFNVDVPKYTQIEFEGAMSVITHWSLSILTA